MYAFFQILEKFQPNEHALYNKNNYFIENLMINSIFNNL